MTKRMAEVTQLTSQVNKLESKLSTNIEVTISDLNYEIHQLKEHEIHGLDKTLLGLLGTGGEWKILIGRVDNLEKFMFEKQSSSSLSSGSLEDDGTDNHIKTAE